MTHRIPSVSLLLLALVALSPMLLRAEEREETPVPLPEDKPVKKSDDKQKKKKQPKGEAIAEEIDLIGDKPEAIGEAVTDKPDLLEKFEGKDPLSSKARQCYALIDESRGLIIEISEDLDAGGKEVTRLIRTSDKLCHKITEFAEIWPDHGKFRDNCITAKRSALLLNDELSQSPRRWQHVRWAFRTMVQDVRKLRILARDMAEAEPKPIPVIDKSGKVVYIDAPVEVDPELLRREARRRESEAERARVKRAEAAKTEKDNKLPLDLNDAP